MTHVPKVGSDFRLRKSAPDFDPVCLPPKISMVVVGLLRYSRRVFQTAGPGTSFVGGQFD